MRPLKVAPRNTLWNVAQTSTTISTSAMYLALMKRNVRSQQNLVSQKTFSIICRNVFVLPRIIEIKIFFVRPNYFSELFRFLSVLNSLR